ncbi:MAG: 30S ribosomal protein S20 [Clostridiales bacterium]|nr:30S ribosomal protein S20 [Clostridiales bacterium]
MANIKSAKKRILVNATKAAQNKAFKTALKTSCKKLKAAVDAGDKAAAEAAYKEAVVMTDKAVTKGILHKNKAARKKSQYTVALNKMA